MKDDRFLCIHGHFYQPPRENPWTGSVEPERSALPRHDWNERVTEECYRPCTAARILGEEDRISELVNLFSRLSFNVGPTLMAWLEHEAPTVYDRILAADVESRRRYGGQGSAIAQAYNHMILPLANERDRRTQIRWGRRDFEHRFGRSPEGMWLPETAVDTASLEALAAEGVRFTILAPYQAALVRPPGGERLGPPDDGGVDPGIPYVQVLPSGKSIVIFYYDGPMSQAVAFDRLLDDGPQFAGRLNDVACSGHGERRLTSIATDGESYGHHHRHGEMALAWTFRHLEESEGARPTVYGAYLDRSPPLGETRVADRTAWSCAHGVERWRSACGCSIGGGDPAGLSWRVPLREGLDALRDSLSLVFEREGGRLLRDPWEARDGWIDCVLDPVTERIEQFVADRSVRALDGNAGLQVRALLEMQRNAMLMFTSCGWFFDDIGGIETRQILRYAGRALDLARKAGSVESADRAEAEFLRTLTNARGRTATGDAIYVEERDGCRTDLGSAAAHVALGAAADGGRGSPLVPGAAFAASMVAESVERPKGESVTGTIEVEARWLGESARFEFGAARGQHGRVMAAVWLEGETGGPSRLDRTVSRILDVLSSPAGAPSTTTFDASGLGGPVLEPGLWMRPDAWREIEERAVRSESSIGAAASYESSDRTVPISNPLIDGPLGWRLDRWSAALKSLAALLAEEDPDPVGIRNRSLDLRAWTLGPSVVRLASGHASRRSARLHASLGGDVLTEGLTHRLERDVRALNAGSADERRLLERLLAALASARTLGLHPDTWETQTEWWSYARSVGTPDDVSKLRDRVGRKLGFE